MLFLECRLPEATYTMSRLGLALLCSCILVPAVAGAQPDRGTVFITGGAFAAVERAPDSSGPGFDGPDANGTVPGGTLGLGVFLTDHVSARVEWAMTDRLKTDASPIAYPASTFEMPGGMFGLTMPGLGSSSIYVPDYTQSRRTSAVFSLVGYHVGRGRVSLEALGGLGLLNENLRTQYDVRILAGRGAALPRSEYESSSYYAVGVVGTDIHVALTDHAAVVPTLRAYATGGRLSVRPGLSLRWTF